jgi:hypothetical protein
VDVPGCSGGRAPVDAQVDGAMTTTGTKATVRIIAGVVDSTLRGYWRSLMSHAGSVRLRWQNETAMVEINRKPSAP